MQQFHPVKNVVEASEFRLVDPNGNLRGHWVAGADGEVVFQQRGPDGKLRHQLSINQDGSAGLALFDSQGELTAVFQNASNGSPGLVLYSPRHQAMKLSATVDQKSGSPLLTLHGGKGAPLIQLAEVDGGGAMTLKDYADRTRGLLGITPSGDAGVLFYDPRGDSIFRAPAGFQTGIRDAK